MSSGRWKVTLAKAYTSQLEKQRNMRTTGPTSESVQAKYILSHHFSDTTPLFNKTRFGPACDRGNDASDEYNISFLLLVYSRTRQVIAHHMDLTCRRGCDGKIDRSS
jgi:hypothetical protein